jgi:pyridoxal phosphate enzyme (YggS family)
MRMALQDKLKEVQDNIAAAALRGKRNPNDVTLVAVTKNATPDAIKQMIGFGVLNLAESRVQQMQQRAAQIDEWLNRQQGKTDKKLPAARDVVWHMIGHLQRNKVKPVLQICRYIHSVDSLRLAEEVHTGAAKVTHPLDLLLEVNVAEESAKYGVAVGAALHLAEQIDTMEGIRLVGLMTMAPQSENPEDARRYFVRLREVFDDIKFRKVGGNHFKHLSMGMSGDYQVAVEEGATMVRIGTALFGPGAAV